MFRKFFLFLFLVTTQVNVWASEPTTEDSEIIQIDSSFHLKKVMSNRAHPLIFTYRLTRSEFLDQNMYIFSDLPFDLFINNSFFDSHDSIRLTHDSFQGDPPYLITVQLSQKDQQVYISNTHRKDPISTAGVVLQNSPFFYFTNVLAVFFLIYAAVVKLVMGRELQEYFRIGFIFSAQNRDENIFRIRMASQSTLLMIIAIIFLAAFITVQYVFGSNSTETFATYLLSWLKWVGLYTVLLILKIVLLQFFTFVFNIAGFHPFHFYNYLRITFLWLFFTAILTTFIHWFYFPENYTQILIILIVSGFIIRSLVLFLKLNSELAYKFFHLFSYLCATELFPFFWLLYMSESFLK